jgi:hypothetical protein
MPSVGVFSRYSRLLCDPNRPKDSTTMFRPIADGLRVQLNAEENLSHGEQQMRIDTLYKPYHDALGQVNFELQPKTILSVHSSVRADGSGVHMRVDAASHTCIERHLTLQLLTPRVCVLCACACE